MRALISILLAYSMVVLPLQSFALSACACEPTQTLNQAFNQSLNQSPDSNQDQFSAQTQPADSCCSPATPNQSSNLPTDQTNPDEPSAPCNDSQCPARCCVGSVQPSFVIPAATNPRPAQQPQTLQPAAFACDLPQPHLQRLKRPPKTA
ncbi:MAG: hypothetical protein AB8C13_11150 [Phycisphaerales bacterium]